MDFEALSAAECAVHPQYAAPHGVTLPPDPQRRSLHSEAETTNAMNVTLAPALSADDLIDFASWFSVPADNNFWPELTCYEQDLSVLDIVGSSVTEGSLQKPWDVQLRSSFLPQFNIAELYRRNQDPEIDKDAVEPRHYDPASAEVEAPLVFPDMTVIPHEDIEAENLAHVEEVPAELTNTVFDLANDMQLKSNYPQFIELRIPPAPVLNAWVQLYFEHFHPMFPVLHKPTFSTSRANPFLVLAVAALGAHFSDINGAQLCLRAMHELTRRYTSYTCEKLNLKSRELWMTQTILLNQLGLMYSGDRRALELAEIFQAVPVTLARRKRLFTNTLPQERLGRLELPLGEKWQISILDEQRRRAGFAIWLIDAAYDYSFDLCTTMRADELQNCFPQPEDRWDASNAQVWATFGEESGPVKNITLGQVIKDKTWRYVWSKTGTLGKQTILQYLANVVNDKDYMSPASPSFSPEQRHAALEALETLLEETGDQGYGHSLSEVKASAAHRVMILSTLSLYHTPTSHIVPLAIKVIYGKMNDDSWMLTIDRWRSSSCQGRMGALYAAHVFETVRSARCIHFMTPVLLLRAVLVLWLYSTIHGQLRRGREYQLEIPSVVLDLKSLDTPATKQWIANGSGCIKLPGISNLLSRQGRRKTLEDAVVVMRSLKAWGISSMYAQLLERLRLVEDIHPADLETI
ncbi:fungal-specific transcription factor domain-containing protein [Aspergillus caelatus]|uniref:Fungal-specific transcription factor domain-containing protein n=1 Tax=Aspergillus caelatus TaxID=61420 RepID=A0A5N7AL96_9EURO|nr:fungal-specific transcription factor domain-containing protein [Aspergillus caelatus]KAE8370483.1 fungal-specific transcription factor domain-containing protein [Aspergillus caelatus]